MALPTEVDRKVQALLDAPGSMEHKGRSALSEVEAAEQAWCEAADVYFRISMIARQ